MNVDQCCNPSTVWALTKLWASGPRFHSLPNRKVYNNIGETSRGKKLLDLVFPTDKYGMKKNPVRKVTVVVIWSVQARSRSTLLPWWSALTHPVKQSLGRNPWATGMSLAPAKVNWWDGDFHRPGWWLSLGKENPGLETATLLSFSQGSWEELASWVHVPELVFVCHNI